MLEKKILDRFVCTGCGDCCRWTGSVLLDDEDIPRLASFLGMPETEFIQRQTRLAPSRRQLALLDQQDGSCAFLAGNRCSVYEVRPNQCRSFPHAWHVQEGCPALDELLRESENH